MGHWWPCHPRPVARNWNKNRGRHFIDVYSCRSCFDSFCLDFIIAYASVCETTNNGGHFIFLVLCFHTSAGRRPVLSSWGNWTTLSTCRVRNRRVRRYRGANFTPHSDQDMLSVPASLHAQMEKRHKTHGSSEQENRSKVIGK